MQYQISKEAFEKLPEDLQKEYTLSGDKATLKLEGEGAPTHEAVQSAEDKRRLEEKHRKAAEKARDEAEAAAEKLREDLGKASGKEEIDRIKSEHQAELERIRGEREAEQKAAKEARHGSLKKETAEKFANENFTIPDLMVDQFSKRLSVEEVNGEPVVRVLDIEGKATALSLTELQQEFLDNEAYSTIIKANAGGGGGATPGGGGGATHGKKLSEMTATEEAIFGKENPEAYEKMLNAE